MQFLRVEHFLRAECVGSAEIGGPLALSPTQLDQIRQLGWEEPAQVAEELRNPLYERSTNYLALFPSKQFAAQPSPEPAASFASATADSAAKLAVDTLRGPFGAVSAADVDITRDR